MLTLDALPPTMEIGRKYGVLITNGVVPPPSLTYSAISYCPYALVQCGATTARGGHWPKEPNLD